MASCRIRSALGPNPAGSRLSGYWVSCARLSRLCCRLLKTEGFRKMGGDKMKKGSGSFLAFAAALLCLAPAAIASNPLVFVGPSSTSGNGLGAVLTSVTVQKTGSEQGCVAWNGSADVIGAAA